MQFDVHIPRRPLGDFVAVIWEWRGVRRAHAFERLMPTGEAALIVNLKEDAIRVYDARTIGLRRRTRGAVMLGAYAEPSVIDCVEQEHVFGVQFRAGGAFAFLREPLTELANQHVALEELWPREGLDFRVRLLEAGSAAERFALAERELLRRWRGQPRRHPAVEYALGRRAGTTAELAAATGLSQRRFIELFKREVGLTPKVYARVKRFQSVLRRVHRRSEPGVDWADVAQAAGYHDQPHLVHEFGALAGMRPGEYVALATEHLNHVPVPAEATVRRGR